AGVARDLVMRGWLSTEDGWAVWLGLLLVVLALPTAAGYDLLGWAAATQVWVDPAQAVRPVSPAYARLPGAGSVGLTYLLGAGAVSVVLTYLLVAGLVGVGAAAQGFDLRRFLPGFTVIYGCSYACWLIGHYAYIAQTPDKRAAMGLSWSLGLTGEAGYIVALL